MNIVIFFTQVLAGNTATNKMVEYELMKPFVARYVRINPQTWNYYPSLRFDVLGCTL